MRIILASKSGVRKEILKKNKIDCDVEPSNVDEDEVKAAMLNENATPTLISKNLAELKANKVSNKNPDRIVLGADSVIDFQGELISKPKSRQEALEILIKLNKKKYKLRERKLQSFTKFIKQSLSTTDYVIICLLGR